MTVTMQQPPYPGGDLRRWALQMVEYLQRTAPIAERNIPEPILLARLTANSRATEDGILLFNPATGQVVISYGGAWTPAATTDATDNIQTQIQDILTRLTAGGL